MEKITVKQVLLIEPEIMNISDLIFDKTNPNVMSKEKLESLGKFMVKIGFRLPVQIRKQTSKIIDGSHRTRWMLNNGYTKVLVQKIECTEAEAKEYRIIFNELKGELDETKFAKELQYFKKHGTLDEFAELMVQEKKYFEQKIEVFEESDFKPDESIDDTIIEGMENFSINFRYTNIADYEFILQKLKLSDKNKELALLKLVGK